MEAKNFENLSEEKRQSIMNAGLLCFSKSGYKKTAISEIAKEAGVSKAAIFHYFGSKKDLYLYLYNYAIDEMTAGRTCDLSDLFDSFLATIKNRMKIEEKYPAMYDFLQLLQQEQDYGDDAQELSQIDIEKAKRCTTFESNVNCSKFKEEYDLETATNLALWVSLGCISQLSKTLSRNDVYAEVERYLSILKKTLYKPEYL